MKKKFRYMVVDDDATNNMICEFTIKRFCKDADIKSFTVPEKALTFIKEDYSTNPEAIATVLFLDINMPTMTGWEFLHTFSEFEDALKQQFSIYILSSSIEDFTEEADNYSNLQGFLSKPLKVDTLEKIAKEL
jgi:two-component SAPR family response regulator